MNLDDFRRTLAQSRPPEVSPLLCALWHAGKGDWDAAHEIAQAVETADGSWVHAYLHRVEGDDSNARYWYRRAGQPEAQDSLDAEWDRLAGALLGKG